MNTNTSPAPATEAARQCLCGCGEDVRSKNASYRPGHDARHVGFVARRMVLTRSQEALEELPSEPLRARAVKMAEGLSKGALGRLVSQDGESDLWRIQG